MPSLPAALALRFVSRKGGNSISSLDEEDERRFNNTLASGDANNHNNNTNNRHSSSSSPENDPYSSTSSSTISSYCPLLTSPSCVHYGYLYKRGLKNKKWQKRFFLLYSDGFMLYYKSQQDIILNSEHPRGVIYLKPQKQVFVSRQSNDVTPKTSTTNTLDHSSQEENSTIPNNNNNSSFHGFVLTVCSRRYSLACESEQDKNEWIEKITMVAYHTDHTSTQSTTIAENHHHSTSSSPPTQTLPSMNGTSSNQTTSATGTSNAWIGQSRRRLYGDAERVSESIDQLEREGIFKILQGIERLENLMKLLNNERNSEEINSIFSSRTLLDHSQLPYYCRNANNFTNQSQHSTTNPYSNSEDQSTTTTMVIDMNSHPTERLQVLNEYLLNESSQRLKEVYKFVQSRVISNSNGHSATKSDCSIDGPKQKESNSSSLEEENEKLKAKIRQLTLDNQQLQDKNEEYTKHKQLLVKEVKKLRGIIKENNTLSNHHTHNNNADDSNTRNSSTSSNSSNSADED
ncbi:hypothetical protein FDP41_011315 [Naegleria fowleri]|uniref:PH domain-containing protein n=1 Tax=Naegleria fowleri TaxID=5763 RepID=A0A6A5CAH7_NAEFO|nr:uncharacterized protein FDP41_011315 [Naegleria fowleri]KAF0982385.1 hypothetical protein FDP41_011315 [Naegleria fowleri]CAG4708029.1 unnamed protein product [Naegleria fowleri]